MVPDPKSPVPWRRSTRSRVKRDLIFGNCHCRLRTKCWKFFDDRKVDNRVKLKRVCTEPDPETQTVSFDMPFNWMTLTRMTEFCRLVFFSVDDYPASTAIIVFGNLYLLFQEFSWRVTDELERVDYRQCAELCRSNFEICISNLDILLPATLENVEALLLGVSCFLY